MLPIVIIGSGLAGYGLLREIRKRNAGAPITVITADDGRAYAKPNLSNALAAGKTPERLSSQDAAAVATAQGAQILTHTRVSAIDPVVGQVETDKGPIRYDRLILALGADPFPHGLSGDAADRVMAVNDLADYTRFRAALDGRQRVTVIGGGLIGCEFANDLIASGYAVDVVHRAAWPLERMLPEALGRQLVDALDGAFGDKGVRWHFGATALNATHVATHNANHNEGGLRLTLSDGTAIDTDVVLSAIGLKPRTALAQAAGLAVNRGIVTDALLATSDPRIYAMGDCAEVEGQVLPFVQPLLIQARALAATLTGTPTPVIYPPMPVVVKTPANPLAVLPPPPGAPGNWVVSMAEKGAEARFESPEARLLGFALSGAKTGERNRLAQELQNRPI